MDKPSKPGLNACTDDQGILSPCGMLANPYVPVQESCPKQYNSHEALSQGTLFPGLNIPFFVKKDGTPVVQTPAAELKALDFVLQELKLYLDTHPTDEDAFALFQNYTALRKEGQKKYIALYGPVSCTDTADFDRYVWINGPWPWEYKGGDK